ncbi:MAG: 2,3-diphosphoglycerate-dependent phosphoglycerate mutase [Acidimicrobiales bacterium]
MYELILVRHGRSEWNDKNLFTGWYDCPLIEQGRDEAHEAARLLAEAGLSPTVLHTSVLQRAIETAEIVLADLDRRWIPVRRSWRLNERHYGDLTGLDKAETLARHGPEQLRDWRRGYRTPPPDISDDNQFNPNNSTAYAGLPPELVPKSECLADVVERMLPYWYDSLVPDLRAGHTVLVAAHGNSLRALVKHLDGIGDDEIVELNIPTGMPLRYELGTDMSPMERRHPIERALDPEAAAAGAAEVAAQAG